MLLTEVLGTARIRQGATIFDKVQLFYCKIITWYNLELDYYVK